MKAHRYSNDLCDPDGDRWVAKAWCSCGFTMLGAAPTVGEAERITWGKYYNHRGFAAAAGPGWNGVGL